MEYPKVEYKITAFIPETKGREVTMNLSADEAEVIQQVISRFGGLCTVMITDDGEKQLKKNIAYMEADYINRGY